MARFFKAATKYIVTCFLDQWFSCHYGLNFIERIGSDTTYSVMIYIFSIRFFLENISLVLQLYVNMTNIIASNILEKQLQR